MRSTICELHSRVALKVISLKSAAKPDAAEMFRREILLARQVTHPNVCRIYDLGHHEHPEHGDLLFLTMEFLEGTTLADRVRTQGPLTKEEALPLHPADDPGVGRRSSAQHRASRLQERQRDSLRGERCFRFGPAEHVRVAASSSIFRNSVRTPARMPIRASDSASASAGRRTISTASKRTPGKRLVVPVLLPCSRRTESSSKSPTSDSPAASMEWILHSRAKSGVRRTTWRRSSSTGNRVSPATSTRLALSSTRCLPPSCRIAAVPGQQALRASPAPPWEDSLRVAPVVKKCMAYDPADRYATVDDVWAVLNGSEVVGSFKAGQTSAITQGLARSRRGAADCRWISRVDEPRCDSWLVQPVPGTEAHCGIAV